MAHLNIKKLIEVCEIIGGGTPSKSNLSFYSGNIPWATVRDMHGDVISKTEFAITEEAVKNSSTHIIPKDSVVIATRVGLGKVCLLQHETAINQDLKGISPKKHNELLVKYLFYWFKTKAKEIEEKGTGATVQGVKVDFINSLQIPVPPLHEQKRIVALLDQAFAGIATAKANAEKNLLNAREIFDTYLDNIFSTSGEGWLEKCLGDIASIKGGKRVPKGYRLETNRTNHPYIRVTDFNDQGSIDLADIHYVNNDVHKLIKNYTISERDLYISIAGTIGKTGMVPKVLDGANLTENACKLVFKKDIEPKFTYYFTKTNSFLNQAGLNTRVAAMPKLALSRLATIKLSIPKEISVQQNIVRKVDTLIDETNQLEHLYQKKLLELDELKKTILQKAFAGELTEG